MRSILPAISVGFTLCFHSGMATGAQPLPAGSGQQEVKLKGESIKIFTYRPNCR